MSFSLLSQKRAQIKMMETIMVLIVFFFLLVIGLVFYANVQLDQAKENVKKYRDLRAIENMNKLLFLPELQCGGSGEEFTCVDIIKYEVLSKIMNNGSRRVYYSDELGESIVTIREVYPGNRTWPPLYNRTSSPVGVSTDISVLLWDPIKDSYGIGLITIKTG